MLGSAWYQVDILFKELPEKPHLRNDPLAKQVPHNQLYLRRLRELHLAHSVQYTINASTIDNLYSRLKLATERVSESIIGVLGHHNESAQKAAAAFRGCRLLEAPDDISRRTMKYTGPIQVVKEDPVAHKDLPTFVWKTPGLDAADCRNSAKWRTEYTPEMFARYLVHDHIFMFRDVIEQQQHIIRCLLNALSEQTVISLLHKLLKNLKVPSKSRIRICAKVAASKCHWTTAIPKHWLSEPVKATSTSQHPTCVIEEEHTGSSSNKNNHNSNSSSSSNKNKKNHNSNSSSSSSNNNTKDNNSKHPRLFFVRIAKAVAAAGVTVASMLANRHGL